MSMYCNQESLATTIACGRELSACLTRSKQLSHTERNERVARIGKAVGVIEAEEAHDPADPEADLSVPGVCRLIGDADVPEID